MVELVLWVNSRQDIDADISCLLIFSYAHFLSQKLELWMFVPCDEDGNVIEYKEPYEDGTNIKYQQAKERVLFEGFEVVKYDAPLLYFSNGLRASARTIEDLIRKNPTLTPTALKMIGL